MKLYTAFYCELQRSIDQMIKLIFQVFLDKCKQACKGVHYEEFEASEISKPSVSKSY